MEISLSLYPSPPPFGDGGLRVLPGKVTRIEIMTVQSDETHNTNKVEKKNVLNLKRLYFTIKFLLSLPRRPNKIRLWTHAYYCSRGPPKSDYLPVRMHAHTKVRTRQARWKK